MPFEALVVDQYAIGVLGAAVVDNDWFQQFDLPSGNVGLKRVVIGGTVYILSSRADEKSHLLVVNAGPQGVFALSKSPRHAFERIIHVAISRFEKGVSIPIKWRQFTEGALLSIYAQTEAVGAKQRIYFDRSPGGSQNIFAFAITQVSEDFDDVPRNADVYKRAIDKYLDAVVSEAPATSDVGSFGITLTQPLGMTLVGGANLEEWYDRKLTVEQRRFVDRDHRTPVRLKGAAGTGKTVSMAIKCLIDLYRFEDTSHDASVAFITHSTALAHDVLPGMFMSLDPSFRWMELKHSKLWVGSLYELAQELMQYERKELKPLSADGREGRELQALFIEDAIAESLKNTRFLLRELPRCSTELKSWITEASEGRGSFVPELMNEFACVIDAENIRKGTPEADHYISAKREPWQMSLPTEADRDAVLEIHDRYCAELERAHMLSMTQMIADVNRYLVSHEWRQLRDTRGFDLIFVDEFHYFDRAERMTLHNLFRRRSINEGRLPLFMAYDFKQAPTDAFLTRIREDAGNTFKSVKAGETELVELTQIFRSTPQIAKFISDLDGSFPALDLADEWGAYSFASNEQHGSVPRLAIYHSMVELLDGVFREAQSIAQREGGRQVAVLCMNDDLFGKYLSVGRIRGKFIPLTSRDDLGDLKYAGKRVILSTPDYVAGLQFHSVFLLNVDRADLSDADSIGKRRRFVSRCYLGASRAAKFLQVVSNSERGGPADILNGPLEAGSLVT